MIEPPKVFTDSSLLPSETVISDTRASMLRELFSVQNPSIRKGTPEHAEAEALFVSESAISSVYVFYPWLKKAVRTLPEEEYFSLRTARNRNIITSDEQNKYRNGSVAIAGLSVGSSVVYALAMSGGPRHMKIADFDVVESTNLNRLRAGLPTIGELKTDAIAKSVWELDPYAEIELYEEGVQVDNIEQFLLSPRVDVAVDEMESIEQKIRLRIVAKKHKVPVLMATDNGNGVILDVERFDLEPDRPIFHGLISIPDPTTLGDLSYREWLKMATHIVGPEYLEDRMRDSILEIGKTIPSVPQLGISASFAGITVAYAIRLLLSGEELPSGRYTYTLEELIDKTYNDSPSKEKREASIKHFLETLSSEV